MIAFGNCVLEKKFMRCLMTLFCQQIDNDLSISRNVSSNKMIHAILALVFLTKLFLSSRFSAPKFINNIPMFFESSPDLWFKVVDAIFDENKVFSESSRFRFTVLKLNSNQLEIVGDLLHGSHPHPYFEMKRLLTQTYGITDQQRYASLSKMTLGFDKPSTLLRKMKSTFRGERLTNAMSELLRGLFLQALPKSVKLHLVGETNLTLL